MHYTLSLSVNTERPLENKNRRRHSPDNHSLLRLPSASRCIKIPLLLLLSLIKIAENCTFQKIGKQNFSSPPQMLHELYVDRYMHGKQFRKRHFLQPPPNTVEEPADVYLKACSVNMGNSGWTLAVRLSALYVWETTCFVRAWTQLKSRLFTLENRFRSLSLSPCASENPIQLTLCNYRRGRAKLLPLAPTFIYNFVLRFLSMRLSWPLST